MSLKNVLSIEFVVAVVLELRTSFQPSAEMVLKIEHFIKDLKGYQAVNFYETTKGANSELTAP